MVDRRDILSRSRTRSQADWRRAARMAIVSILTILAVVSTAQAQPDPIGGNADQKVVLAQLLDRAQNGDANSQFALGEAYALGKGISGGADYKEAMKWWRHAAEQGVTEAQFNLGRIYLTAQGTPKDLTQAHTWMSIAAASLAHLGWGEQRIGRYRDEIEIRLTDVQLEESRKRVREWNSGHPGRTLTTREVNKRNR